MKSGKTNILITAASRRVALIRGFRAAMNKLGLEGNVVTTDVSHLSPGLYVSDRFRMVPLTTDPSYVARIKDVCLKEEVCAIVPTIDDELELMGSVREEFAAIGVTIVISSPATCRVCNDKLETYRFFSEHGVPTPITWLPSQLPSISELSFPLFLKPRQGRGSVGTHKLRNERELSFFSEYEKDPIIQEYLEGPEYTLDTFVDADGEVVAVVPRRRLWVRAGVMDKGRTERIEELLHIGADVARKLRIVGPANIQVKYHEGRPKVFEVNPRFSGGIPLTIAAGVDFPAMVLRLVMGEKLEPRVGEFIDGMVMMAFEDGIFRPMEVKGFSKLMDSLER